MLRVVLFLTEFKMNKITNKLHPLYSHVVDNDRCSGRTTVIALKAISAAITSPNIETAWSDHVGGNPYSLRNTLIYLIKCMQLRFFDVEVEDSQVYIRCERLNK